MLCQRLWRWHNIKPMLGWLLSLHQDHSLLWARHTSIDEWPNDRDRADVGTVHEVWSTTVKIAPFSAEML